MIINQSIRNGFVTVNKTGAYFSLISAGGVVNVRLSEKGRTVLDTKMWVGMSIDKAIPFDEITIKGDDGAVEFWAGDVSMNQSRASITGASAIKTNQVKVLGSAKLTNSNVTRTAIRLRTDKDIYIGGAGVSGSGWRIPAGTSEEIPVAGTLYGYRDLPTLDMDGSEFLETQADAWHSNASVIGGGYWVADDETVKLAWIKGVGIELKLWQSADGLWIDHPSFFGMTSTSFNLIACSDGNLYAFRFIGRYVSPGGGSNNDGELYVYKSTDNGLTFKQLAFLDWGAITDSTKINNSMMDFYLTEYGNIISLSFSGLSIGFNIKTRVWKALESGVCTGYGLYDFNHFTWINDELTSAININRALKRLQRTDDGGNTWRTLRDSEVKQYRISNFMGFIAIETGTSKLALSSDYGESFTDFNDVSIYQKLPIHLFNGVWTGFSGNALKVHYVVADTAKTDTTVSTGGSGFNDGFVLPDGTIYRLQSGATTNDKWHLSVSGDLSPAVVEVMELLS